MTELESPHWPTVGVCWALTTATTVVLFVIAKVVSLLLRKRRKLRKPATGRPVWSTENTRAEKEQNVPLMDQNPVPRRNGSSSNSSPHSGRTNSQPTDRRKQDDVSRWCSEHGLPESLVYTLREQGFETKAALDALRPEDLHGSPAALQLPSTAVKVQLRQVLTKLHGTQRQDSANRNSKKSLHHESPSYKRKPVFNQLLSDSGVASEAQSPTSSSDVFLPGMASIDELDSGSAQHEDRKRRQTPRSHSHETSKEVNCVPRFNGLLSDKGLWEMTKLLGHEWRHLATLLGISTQTQEQLTESHPYKVKNAIYEMLMMWRNEATGNKEQIKARLHKSLVAVERNDIAKLLMDEQTHGSNSKLNSISSII